MRPVKTAIAEALRTDEAVSALVPRAQIYAVERATLPTLPAVEVIALSSERVDDGPLCRHELSCEITAAHSTEDGCRRAVRCCRAGRPAADRMLRSGQLRSDCPQEGG